MDTWIGPAVTATIISSLIAIVGWYVALRTSLLLDRSRRDEKVRDTQAALLAEIAGNRLQFAEDNLERLADDVRSQLLLDESYVPFVPREASTIIFDVVINEIHVLPHSTIRPVVTYYKQLKRIAFIVEDLRSAGYSKLSRDRKFEVYLDYLGMIRRSLRLATEAERALQAALGLAQSINSSASGPSSPSQSASEAASASSPASTKSPSTEI